MALYDVGLAGGEAEKIAFDNSVSGMYSDNVQGAIDEVTRYTGLVKSKNLLINTFETKSYNGGGTATVNKDKSITIDGTFTDSDSTVHLDIKNNNLELGKQYVASISKVDVGITFNITFYTSDTTTVDCASTNTSINFTTPNAIYLNRFFLIIPSGTYDKVTVYPMISKEGGEYEPYVEDVQTQINILNDKTFGLNYFNVLTLSKTLEENHVPHKELQAQWNKFEAGKLYTGRIMSGTNYHYIGFRPFGEYGSFLLHSYSGDVIHVRNNGGSWSVKTISNNSDFTAF